MRDNYSVDSAHQSYPLSASALQSASVTPDFQYLDIIQARDLNARLAPSIASFSPGELAAIGLIGKASLAVIKFFLEHSPDTFNLLDNYIEGKLSPEVAHSSLSEVVDCFPTSLTFTDPTKRMFYTFGSQSATPSRHSYYYSLLLILLAEKNPSIVNRDGLFTDQALRSSLKFHRLLSVLQEFFANQSTPGAVGVTLVDFLLEPILRFPSSIFDQLLYIHSRWGNLLDADLLGSLLISLDQIKEESLRLGTGSRLPEDPLGYLSSHEPIEPDSINFSPDKDWMPRVILQAKNVFVWLDQLSREYQRPITTLDQVPTEELAELSSRGINALWLIGLWERSPASQKIKQICGNPEAVSSAYSLYDYSIAKSLGGDTAYQQLSAIASRFNIRLAADMVPNHMGIDSRWVVTHPDRFLSLDHPPFPGYTFAGVDLSSDSSISIYLEDHYYDKTDAAVVFKRSDNRSGENRYIYHGNDGTSMPWNDTAQLDFLNPEVRETVIQTVLHVARKFPIIRFDAAMTLSKKHYQRLWFPQPGTGGAIPTRSNHSLTKEQFNARMPIEFWRELVDRVAEEVPDTLLLAEAFWMMEGYFVRTLGMHRVYNSAFMHMLRDEDNVNYRELIVNTLEYDPQILKRYVNFMNNPDEDTAISQFGSGGKYFGTCLLMSTLPGLPMFGHGQIEGFSEKYGMEYKKAYYAESPNQVLVDRHKKEIFPLLHKRYLFSEVNHFHLYDLTMHDGLTNEDVFIYSNRFGDERALIVFHNRWGDTRGNVIRSTPVNGQTIDLLSGLGFSPQDGDYLIFQDQISGLEYIRSIHDLLSGGLYLDLGAYDYHAFINFKPVFDQDGSYSLLANMLSGSGTYDLNRRRLEHKLSPLSEPISSFLSIFERETLAPDLDIGKLTPKSQKRIQQAAVDASQVFYNLLSSLFPEQAVDADFSSKSFVDKFFRITNLLYNPLSNRLPFLKSLLVPWAFISSSPISFNEEELEIILYAYANTQALIRNLNDNERSFLIHSVTLAVYLTPFLEDASTNLTELSDLWFSNPVTRQFINVHDHDGQTWFHKESMEALIDMTFNLLLIGDNSPDLSLSNERVNELLTLRDKVLLAQDESEFCLDKFVRILSLQQGGD